MVTKSRYLSRNSRGRYNKRKSQSNLSELNLKLPLVSIQQLVACAVIVVFVLIASKIPQLKFENFSPKIKTQITSNIKIENIQNSFEKYMEKIQAFNPFDKSNNNISKK